MVRLGAHMSTAKHKYLAINRGLEIGCESVQVFVKSNRSWNAGPLDEKEIKMFKDTREANKDKIFSVFCHGTYLVNLAAQEKDILDKSITCFKLELDYSTKLGLDFLVFHPGAPKEMGFEKGVKQIAASLNKIAKELSKSPVKILLENTAGQGSTIGKMFSELKQILDKLEEPNRFGICYDTCHGWAAGYDISKEKTYEKIFKELDDEIGIDRLHAFHINDSKYELGTHHDRHEHIGEGFIGTEGFKFLVNDARFKDHPATLETPKTENFEEDLKRLRSLIK
ncbi:MAG: deoxyribonuclease IV [Candidatus Hodarchaeota archaeon]